MARNPRIGVLYRFLFPDPLNVPLSAGDRQFLERFRCNVMQRYSDSEFTTARAAESVGISRMHLNRKLRQLTGQSTHEFIRTMRLEAARELLAEALPVATIARSVGFKNISHFGRAFREKFGATPSVYRAQSSGPSQR